MESSPPPPDPAPSPPPPLDEEQERRVAVWLTLAVLATLTAVKPLGGIAWVGAIAFTFAAVIQLYLPLWRCDKLDRDYDFVGLHLGAWRADVKIVLILVAITFPPYIVAHHLYMTSFHDWAVSLGWEWLADYLPRSRELPTDLDAWLGGFEPPEWMQSLGLTGAAGGWVAAIYWLLKIAATHSLGVALPEETFYRGYLQPRLEEKWAPKLKIFGVGIGKAAVITAALFALGHFLGEWNPLRLGPFIPALVFAWQRNATGSVLGAITYHSLCNILGEILFSLYLPG